MSTWFAWGVGIGVSWMVTDRVLEMSASFILLGTCGCCLGCTVGWLSLGAGGGGVNDNRMQCTGECDYLYQMPVDLERVVYISSSCLDLQCQPSLQPLLIGSRIVRVLTPGADKWLLTVIEVEIDKPAEID